MRWLPLFFLLATALVHADTSVPAPTVKGVIILTSATGKDPVSIAFSNIDFQNFESGVVTDVNGVKTVFDDRAIGKIVYLDKDYYSALHGNTYFLQYASGLRSRETFINISFLHIATPDEAKAIQETKEALEYIVEHYPQSKGLLQPQVEILDADLSRYGQHQVFVNGQWMTPEEADRLKPVEVDNKKYVSFTAKDGKAYDHVSVSVAESGLSVLTSSGGTTIPFDLLPDDLSIFPDPVQKQIKAELARETAAKEAAAKAAIPPSPPPSTISTTVSNAASTATSWLGGAYDQAKSLVGHAWQSVQGGTQSMKGSNAVVIIKGNEAKGTGFLVHTPEGPAVITNLHVIFANPNLQILTNTGAQIKVIALKGAADRDLAMFLIQDDKYEYLDLADASNSVGNAVVTPGNSEGGDVVLNTEGKVLGVGPDRIEISNPIFHGNSGGPVIDTASGKVLGVVTYASTVEPSDAVDKASMANAASAISGPMRYFGLRVDNVSKWEPYDIEVFFRESTLLKEFHENSRCLDSLLNGAQYEKTNLVSYGAPDSKYYLRNDKIRQLTSKYKPTVSGLDNGERVELLREYNLDLEAFADSGVDNIQNPSNFYSFERQDCAKELAYRRALKAELKKLEDKIGHEPAKDHMASPSL